MKQENTTPTGRPRAFDSDEALDRALQVFWRKGYLGASLSDLTEAMGINRPSLYAAFGNKESLFRKALERYSAGPSRYLDEALLQPTARAVAERMLRGVVDMLTNPESPGTCCWVHGALSHGGDDSFREEFAAQRSAAEAALRKRFKRAVTEGDLPANADAGALARFVQTVSFGLSVEASTGASRKELLGVVAIALQCWPK
jgi:AcrR family transcriptional regulator